MKARVAMAISLSAVALAGAACGGDGERSGPGATATTEATLAGAAREFSALADPLNSRLRAINARLERASDADDPAAAARGLEAYADLVDDFRNRLSGIDFPPEARRQADDLASTAAESGADARRAASRVDDPTSLKIALAAWGGSLLAVSGRAAVLRQALGLPPPAATG